MLLIQLNNNNKKKSQPHLFPLQVSYFPQLNPYKQLMAGEGF